MTQTTLRTGAAASVYCLLLLMAAPPIVSADDAPWNGEPFSATPGQMVRAAQQIPTAEDADVEMLLDEITIRIEADGRTSEQVHQVYRILTDSGIDALGTCSVAWSPWHQQRPEMLARVINSEHDEIRLIEREIAEGPVEQEENIFSDQRQLLAPLPAIQVGSIVETLTRVEDSESYFPVGIADYRLFNRYFETRQVRMIVDVPESLPFRYQQHGPGIAFHESVADGRKIFTWVTTQPLSFGEFDVSAPSDVVQGTQVAFSTARTWADVIEAYRVMVESRLKDHSLEAQVAKILDGETDERKKVEKLLAFVQQQVRYTGLIFGDGSIVPTPPSETLRRRYGDCKDQSVLLIAMLRAAGIDASPVLLRSSLGRDVIDDLPGMGMFNHMIVHVEGDQELWIDPTATTVPPGQLPLQDQNRKCLIVRNGETALRRSPQSTPDDNGTTRIRDIRVDESGNSTITETTTYRGANASVVRDMAIATGDRDFRTSLRERAEERLQTKSVSDIRWSSIRDPKIPFEISLKCDGSAFVECSMKSGKVTLIPTFVLYGLAEELFDNRPYLTAEEAEIVSRSPRSERAGKLLEEKQRRRLNNLPIHQPQIIEFINRVHWPVGFQPNELPENQRLAVGAGFLDVRYSAEPGGVIAATYRLNTGTAALTPDEVQQWQEKIHNLADSKAEEWTVTVTASHEAYQHLDKGNLKEGLKLLRTQLSERPDNLSCRIRLAEAYAENGFADAARNLALQTTELNPDAVAALRSAGYIFSLPVFQGASIRQEDHQRAISMFRRGIELDSENVGLKLDLAPLLQTGPNGVLSDKKSLLEAASLFRTVADTLAEGGHLFVLQCLFFAGEHEELLAHMEKYSVTTAPAFHVASISSLYGTERGLSVLRKEVAPDAQYAVLLEAHVLLGLNRAYDKAIELLEVASELPDADHRQVSSLKVLMRPLRHYETLLLPESDPSGVVQRFIVNAMTRSELCGTSSALVNRSTERSGKLMDHVRSVFSDDTQEDTTLLRSAARTADNVSLVNFTVEGNEKVGFRVTASGGFLREVVFFVAPVDGRLKILTINDYAEDLALDALEMVDKGHLVSARQLLTWAADCAGGDLKANNVFLASPFARLWTKADTVNSNAAKIRLAAIALADPADVPNALPILVDMRRRMRPAEQQQIDRVMVMWLAHHQKWKDGLAVVERLVQSPSGRWAYWATKARLLIEDKQYKSAIAWLQSQRQLEPENPLPLRMLATVAFVQGNPAESVRLLRTAAEDLSVGEMELNAAAWSSLFLDSIDDRVYGDAVRSVSLASSRDPFSLHTLAAVCAELGRIEEAMNLLHRCIQLRPDRVPALDDYYVSGRIAEQLEMPEIAQSCYDKVIKSETTIRPQSTAALAAKRRGQVMNTVLFESKPIQ